MGHGDAFERRIGAFESPQFDPERQGLIQAGCGSRRTQSAFHRHSIQGYPALRAEKPNLIPGMIYPAMTGRDLMKAAFTVLSVSPLFEARRVFAIYHHERFDGKGYPEGLKGMEIPEIARIIAVADSYDAMTSNRSYRPVIPQNIVREEMVKGSGTQFDPQFAECMIRMIDQDVDYKMQEGNAEEAGTEHPGRQQTEKNR